MADGERPVEDIFREEHRVLQAERPKEHLPHSRLEGEARHNLDNASRDV
jgi:hypothetical protein